MVLLGCMSLIGCRLTHGPATHAIDDRVPLALEPSADARSTTVRVTYVCGYKAQISLAAVETRDRAVVSWPSEVWLPGLSQMGRVAPEQSPAEIAKAISGASGARVVSSTVADPLGTLAVASSKIDFFVVVTSRRGLPGAATLEGVYRLRSAFSEDTGWWDEPFRDCNAPSDTFLPRIEIDGP